MLLATQSPGREKSIPIICFGGLISIVLNAKLPVPMPRSTTTLPDRGWTIEIRGSATVDRLFLRLAAASSSWCFHWSSYLVLVDSLRDFGVPHEVHFFSKPASPFG